MHTFICISFLNLILSSLRKTIIIFYSLFPPFFIALFYFLIIGTRLFFPLEKQSLGEKDSLILFS